MTIVSLCNIALVTVPPRFNLNNTTFFVTAPVLYLYLRYVMVIFWFINLWIIVLNKDGKGTSPLKLFQKLSLPHDMAVSDRFLQEYF